MVDAIGEWLCLGVAYVLAPATVVLIAWLVWWSARDDRRAGNEARAWARSRGLTASGSAWTYPAEARGTIEGVGIHVRLSGGPGVGMTTLRTRPPRGTGTPSVDLMVRRGLVSLGDGGWAPSKTGRAQFDALFWFKGRDPSEALSVSAMDALVALHGQLNPLVCDKIGVHGATRDGELVVTMVGKESKAETLDAAVTFALRAMGIEPPTYR